MLSTLSARIADFIMSAPLTALIAFVIFLVAFAIFRRTVATAIKIAIVWVLANFVCATLFGIHLPTIPELVEIVTSFIAKIMPL